MNNVFKIQINNKREDIDWNYNMKKVKIDESRMFSNYISDDMIKGLWEQQSRISPFFDNDKKQLYYKARNIVFPQDKIGSKRFRNRAGDKLFQISESFDLFKNKSIFLDLCGGPGAWSEVLLNLNSNIRGYGLTLKSENKSVMWYKKLYKSKRWKALWGDGSGDIYKDLSFLKQYNVDLVVADGGFNVNEKGVHLEHLQELFSARIIVSELLGALFSLNDGGDFCCKIFDTFSQLSASIIYFVCLCFKEVYIIKPYSSRNVNSERYIVGLGKKHNINNVTEYLEKIHYEWDDDLQLESLIPIDIMMKDKLFIKGYKKQTEFLCKMQIQSLKKVMDLCETY